MYLYGACNPCKAAAAAQQQQQQRAILQTRACEVFMLPCVFSESGADAAAALAMELSCKRGCYSRCIAFRLPAYCCGNNSSNGSSCVCPATTATGAGGCFLRPASNGMVAAAAD
jgi:hypothetical protein